MKVIYEKETIENIIDSLDSLVNAGIQNCSNIMNLVQLLRQHTSENEAKGEESNSDGR